MIGWYADWGVFNGRTPSSLNDITFLDFGRPFTIGTTYNSGHIPISSSWNRNNQGVIDIGITVSKEEGQNLIERTMGNDFFTLYCSYSDYYENGKWVKSLIPSIYLSCPNTVEYRDSNNVKCCCLVKSLNVLLIWDNDSGGSVEFYKVSSSLEFLGKYTTPAQGPIFNSAGQKFSYFIFTNYLGDDDLSNSSNYIAISSVVNSEQFRLLGIADIPNNSIWKGQCNRILNYMFSPDSKPDFTVISPENPYEPGGSSGEGGGGGSFDNESDIVEDSSLPTLSSANTGFTRIYNPSLSQVQDLARYLWTDDSVIETIWNHIKQFFENPMEAIIGFNLVPVAVPNGGTKNFALMYIDTGVQMTVAASQFVDVDCGTLELKEYYGSALDYSPNTKVSCFLPFIGNVSLNTDEVMGRTLQVKYRVDICSGSCVAKIAVDGNFIYQYSGHCAINIPLSAADFSSYVNAAISVGKLVGTALAAGAGVGLAATAQDATQQTNQVITTTQIINTVRNPATGRQITAGTQTRVETRESPVDQSSTQASFSGITPQNVSNTVGQIMTSKPHIEHSGGFSGNSGYLGVRRPYLIIERPNMCMPESFQTMNGFPSMITVKLGDCTGFTRVQQVQLTGLPATNPEQAEILQLLKSGVIL
ncbi:hypothetical protein [Bacteroides acidifaciens]|uniref:hypothetical protein n=1 Tax=Bacteroides acidifaciens TaxID=85831 RepID=UPI0025A97C73|nr:hypothetical protein [Bacteroides acidifaciens]